MPLRDDCENSLVPCGHAPESHFLEKIPTGKLDDPLVMVRTACLMPKCDCTHYVPPVHVRR